MPAPVLQFKRGNAGVAGTVPALRPGEPAISLNNFDFFIGIDTSVANNKFFGSHRYWGREDGTNSLRLKLVDKDGTNSINLKSPNTLAGIVTYTLPGTITDGYFLKTNSTGVLSWDQVVSNINIAADTGTPDSVSTGATITFVGGTNVNTAVTDNTITINLDNNINVSGVATVGSFISNNGGTFNGNVQINSNLNVNGNISLGGTTITLRGEDVFIQNKDIILGYTTSVTNTDISTDNTANHAGVAIASTEGTPLVSFTASGINTLPDTYKQLMWFKKNTLGFSTDAFAFNYGVAIGTTTMANGVRLAVGSNVTVTDTTVTATTGNFTNLSGSVTGTISTAISLRDAQNFSITGGFVTASNVSFNGTGPVALAATITPNSITLGTYTSGDYVASITSGNGLTGGTTGEASTPTLAVGAGEGIIVNADDVALKNGTNLIDNKVLKWDNTNGQLTNTVITENGSSVTIGTGVGITQFSSSVSTGTSTSSVPTSSAVINYVGTQVGNIDLTLGINADSGGPSTVATSQTLTISGTANEVETSVSSQTITVGLPNAVVVGTSLSAPTVKTATVQHSNGTQAATVDSSGNITASQNLTVNGDLYVNGTTTQINTNTLTVEDRTIELGRVIAGQPTTTTWDLAVLFNYGDGSAKKAGVVWEASGATKRFQFTTDLNPGADGGPTDTNVPQFTVANFAPIEISSLWINGCGALGALEVIKCNTTEILLENITIDAGTF